MSDELEPVLGKEDTNMKGNQPSKFNQNEDLEDADDDSDQDNL